MKKIFNFLVLYSFFLFPKIPLKTSGDPQNQQGVLIGELLLIISIFVNIKDILHFLRYNKRFNKILFCLFTFFFSYIVISSLVSGLFNLYFPTNAIFYFFRIAIYFALPFVIQNSFTYSRNNTFSFYSFVRSTYVLHSLIVTLIFIYYNLKINPTIGEMLWVSEVGCRVIPLFGLAVNPFYENIFYSIGGGSSNLLATYSIFFVICVYFFEKKKSLTFLFYLIAISMILLAQSRGGVLTIALFLIFISFKNFIRSFSTLFIGLIFFVVLLFLGKEKYDEVVNVIPIFQRIETTISDGELDGSSSARIINYSEVYAIWKSNPYYILFGLGFDENLIEKITGWTLVESFFLSIIFYGGIVASLSFLLYVYIIFKFKNRSIWNQVLFMFVIINSVFNWSVTGGDFLSVAGLFPLISLATLAQNSEANIDNADTTIG